jgi:hypothetical protein
MSELTQEQKRFTLMVAKLIEHSYAQGYELTFGEAYRTPEQAALNASHGVGITHSLHCNRLAVDLNLFLNGEYQADSATYQALGEFWESIGGSWGGRFSKPDGNHFSLSFGGYK